MKIEYKNFYHFYNRTINREPAFPQKRNYLYFLEKYKTYVSPYVTTHAYVLMPTHFHFLIEIQTREPEKLLKNIGIFLGSYATAINRAINRHGSLFQAHSQAKHIDDTDYLINVLNYIHQNPVRRNLVSRLDDWIYSSYPDLSGQRNGTLPSRDLINPLFNNKQEFIEFSKEMMTEIRSKYWV